MRRSRSTIDVSGCLLDLEENAPARPLNWTELFGAGRPVELEVGSGKGLFLVNAAKERPGHDFFGVEMSRKYARLAAERALKHGLSNVKLCSADARIVLARQVTDASLRAIHVYFPDPWWKKRHKKRRVFTESLVASAVRTLEPGGQLHVATDVEEYFEVIRSLIAGRPELLELPPPQIKVPEHELDYLTNFERKFRIEGRSIYRADYKKSAV